MVNLLVIAIGAILIHNFILSRFLGLCPFIGVSKKTETAIGMGMAVIFVMALASAVTWVIWTYLLSPGPSNIFWIIAHACGSSASAASFDLRYLETIAFILVIASLVQFVELVLKKTSPALNDALGIYLPLITTNCAILGVAELNTMSLGYNFLEAVVHGVAAGIGFTLALIMMSGIRERLEFAPVPRLMKGLPIAFIVSGLMSMAFLGFSGLKF